MNEAEIKTFWERKKRKKRKKRQLTERQAWLRLAKEWKDASLVKKCYRTGPWASSGLCSMIGGLKEDLLINDEVHKAMTCKVDAAVERTLKRNPDHWPWAWSTSTKSGVNSRIAFCLRQAKLLTKKRKKGKA